MADPLSVAGLVTGVVSLGLQVAGGLSNYLDAIKGRSEELRSVKQQATNMKDQLLTIQDLLPQVKNSWPESATMVERHMKSCNSELNALWTLLSELSQPPSSGSGIRHKLAEQKNKLNYPFNRSHITRLEDRLATANCALQTALQVTQLNVSIATENRIRQVHDVLLSMFQPMVMRTQSAVAGSASTAVGKVPEKLASSGTGVPLDSIETAMALASKPSLLSASIQSIEEYNTSPVQYNSVFKTCSCRTSRKTTQHHSNWRYFSVCYGTSNTRTHLPSCKFSQIDRPRRSTNFAIECGGVKGLFQAAVALSFVFTRGAGGQSISSTLAYYPTVDDSKAPAFRILGLVQNMICYHGSDSNISEIAKVVQCCCASILILYSRGKASPRDIKSRDGSSIMHAVAGTAYAAVRQYSSSDGAVVQAIASGMNDLVACGAPLDVCDTYGHTACSELWFRRKSGSLSPLFAKLLLPPATDALIDLKAFGLWKHRNSLDLILRDSQLAEASGCGPLSLAARAGDERRVADLIKRYPHSLEEVNRFGHTAVYLAFGQPLCLRMILEASKPSMVNTCDSYGWTPVDYAYALGYRMATQILLGFGCSIKLRCLTLSHDLCLLEDILSGLKQRRDELKRLALERLTETEAQSLGLHESTVLDSRAFRVQELLQNRGVNIPPALHVFENDSASVYHHQDLRDSSFTTIVFGKRRGYDATTTFDKLWNFGFRDVNSFDAYGRLPLTTDHLDARATMWLIEHGADYWTPLGGRSDYPVVTERATPAHFVMGNVIKWELQRHKEYQESERQAERQVFAKMLQVRVNDTCSCECSVGGCTTLSGTLSAVFDARRGYLGWILHTRSSPSLQDLFPWECVDLSEASQFGFTKEDHVAIIRRMTFDAMELTHTCCKFDQWDGRIERHPPEEIDEINSEQTTLLALFADLVIEFERIAYEDRSGVPLIVNDPEEFWIRRWLPRIKEMLDGLDGNRLTEEEISAAEAIGVVWGPQPAEKTATEWDKDDYLPYRPEDVMRGLERIMNE